MSLKDEPGLVSFAICIQIFIFMMILPPKSFAFGGILLPVTNENACLESSSFISSLTA